MDNAKPSTSNERTDEKFPWPFAIKSVFGIISVGGCAFAYKLYRQVTAPENKNLARVQLYNGATLASKALLIASIISVSGFSLFIIGISTILQVNTPREFGSKMVSLFGDRFRISKNKGKAYNSLTELMEEFSETNSKPVSSD